MNDFKCDICGALATSLAGEWNERLVCEFHAERTEEPHE